MKKHPIGILGGTFDPIHLGHIHLATTIYKTCDLQKILLIPCYQSPLKPPPLAKARNRLNMVKLATKNLKHLKIINYEIKQAIISYTFKTLEYLHHKYPTTPLAVIMGIDAFNKFDQWYKWKKILDLAHLIIVNRPHCKKTANKKIINILTKRQVFTPKNLQQKKAGLIFFTDIKPLPISATKIRTSIKHKKNIKNRLTSKVWQYINKLKLYK